MSLGYKSAPDDWAADWRAANVPVAPISHAWEMAARRRRQLARKPGFEPMPNKRVQLLGAQAVERQAKLGLTGRALEQAAYQDLCRQLPGEGFARRLRAPNASKNDCAIYRKAAV